MSVDPVADPITLEIIASALQAAGEEMFAALRKTAMSAIIYEVLDAGTAITDAAGDLVSSGAGTPTFVAVLDRAVKRIRELHPAQDIGPGDVFLTNDPAHGGVTHLNDVVVALPVFAGEELLAWTANIAHWNDVGGIPPGSISTHAREIFQEGLRLPAIKVLERGEPVRSVIDILRANSRLPDFLHGDLWAGIAAARAGERRILELVERYGRPAFRQAIERALAYGEKVARRALRELPRGRFSFEEEQDSGAVDKVTVEISDSEFVVDQGQPRTRLRAQQRLSRRRHDCRADGGGPRPDTGRHFTIVEPELGGWGASDARDGNSALFSPVHGDTYNCPAEVAEGRYGPVHRAAGVERRARRGRRAPRRQRHHARLPVSEAQARQVYRLETA